MLVMLRRDWPGNFRRTVRNEQGQPLVNEDGQPVVLHFAPGVAVDVPDAQAHAIAEDLGKCLYEVVLDGDKPRRIEEAAPAQPADASQPANDASDETPEIDEAATPVSLAQLGIPETLHAALQAEGVYTLEELREYPSEKMLATIPGIDKAAAKSIRKKVTSYGK